MDASKVYGLFGNDSNNDTVIDDYTLHSYEDTVSGTYVINEHTFAVPLTSGDFSDLDGLTVAGTSSEYPNFSAPPVPEAGPVHGEVNDGTSDGLYLVGGDSGSGFKFYPLTVATDPDGTANNGDDTGTMGAEVTNLTGELDTYDGTDNSTFIGDLDGTTDKITSPAPAPSPSTPPVPEAGPVHELNDGTSDGLYLVGGDSGSGSN